MRVRIRRFARLVPTRNGWAGRSQLGTRCGFPCSSWHPLRLHRALPTHGLPKQNGQCNTPFETQTRPTPPMVRAFAAPATTMPSADFRTCGPNTSDVLRHEFATRSRSPVISSTAFHAQPPDLPPAAWMDAGFAALCPLTGCRRPPHPVLVHRLAPLLHAAFRPRLAVTPLRFAITSPLQIVKRTFTS